MCPSPRAPQSFTCDLLEELAARPSGLCSSAVGMKARRAELVAYSPLGAGTASESDKRFIILFYVILVFILFRGLPGALSHTPEEM